MIDIRWLWLTSFLSVAFWELAKWLVKPKAKVDPYVCDKSLPPGWLVERREAFRKRFGGVVTVHEVGPGHKKLIEAIEQRDDNGPVYIELFPFDAHLGEGPQLLKLVDKDVDMFSKVKG